MPPDNPTHQHHPGRLPGYPPDHPNGWQPGTFAAEPANCPVDHVALLADGWDNCAVCQRPPGPGSPGPAHSPFVGEDPDDRARRAVLAGGGDDYERPAEPAPLTTGQHTTADRLVLPGSVELMDKERPPAPVAPPPARHTSQRTRQAQQRLLTDEEFAVLDLLAEADGWYMQLPQAEDDGAQRDDWRRGLRHLENMVMRRAAIRAYPERFTGG